MVRLTRGDEGGRVRNDSLLRSARGIDGVLSPHSSIEEMASHYIAEIRSVQSSGP